ncbi:GP3 protein [Free State vervet virus]|uniref:GP3 protein n=1 Tax=Free State vervet virus TaxID=1737586 RepID=A0A159D6Z0_9NIDO|nr:GP3 protein [Free State vervet virus]ALS54300.1 GP3 protein [Free State vervet virus]
MGHHAVFSLLSLSALLCCVYSYCFEFPNPDIVVQVFLNYTTCHMQGNIIAGYKSLADCHSFTHDEFVGQYTPLNLTYATAAPVGAVVLGLSLLSHIHQNCSWEGTRYCCSSHAPRSLPVVQQALPHLVILAGGALLAGIMSVCLAAQSPYTIKRD